MSALFWAISSMVIYCLGVLISYSVGKRAGIAVGWHQYRDEQIARDKARRAAIDAAMADPK